MSIVNQWPVQFRALYGGEWPSTYVTMDLETSGFSFDRDVITEIAHCLVEDGKITNELSLVLDWSNNDVVPDHWLRKQLEKLEHGMATAGKTCAVNYARMKQEGINPRKALEHYRELFQIFRDKGIMIAAHNGYGFDEKMLNANFAGFNIDPDGFSFGDNGLLDTDCLVKASQISDHERLRVKPEDTLRSYFHRAKYLRVSGVRSGLDDYCFTKYQFAEKYGVQRKDMHNALMDSRCVHYVMEGIRQEISTHDATVPPWADVTVKKTAALKPQQPLAPSAVRRRGQRNSW